MVTIIVYGDIKRRIGTRKIEINVQGKTLRELPISIAKRYNIEDLIFRENKIRSELLILVDGADWNSLGYLDKEVKEGSTIKLVPVWHGG